MAARTRVKTPSRQTSFWAKGFSRPIGLVWSQALRDRFGTTDDPSHAAFITPEGKLVKYNKLTHSGMTRAIATEIGVKCPNGCIRAFLSAGGIKIHDWERQGGGSGEPRRPGGPLIVEIDRKHKITRAQATQLMKFVSARYREEPPTVDVTIHGRGYASGSCYLYPEPAGRRRMQLVQCLRSKLDVRPSIPLDGVKIKRVR